FFQAKAGALELAAALHVDVAGRLVEIVQELGVVVSRFAVEEWTRIDDVAIRAETGVEAVVADAEIVADHRQADARIEPEAPAHRDARLPFVGQLVAADHDRRRRLIEPARRGVRGSFRTGGDQRRRFGPSYLPVQVLASQPEAVAAVSFARAVATFAARVAADVGDAANRLAAINRIALASASDAGKGREKTKQSGAPPRRSGEKHLIPPQEGERRPWLQEKRRRLCRSPWSRSHFLSAKAGRAVDRESCAERCRWRSDR